MCDNVTELMTFVAMAESRGDRKTISTADVTDAVAAASSGASTSGLSQMELFIDLYRQ